MEYRTVRVYKCISALGVGSEGLLAWLSMPETPKPVKPTILTEVVETTEITPHLIRVVVTGGDLEVFPVG